jgi:hypothetical protein
MVYKCASTCKCVYACSHSFRHWTHAYISGETMHSECGNERKLGEKFEAHRRSPPLIPLPFLLPSFSFKRNFTGVGLTLGIAYTLNCRCLQMSFKADQAALVVLVEMWLKAPPCRSILLNSSVPVGLYIALNIQEIFNGGATEWNHIYILCMQLCLFHFVMNEGLIWYWLYIHNRRI